MTTAATAPHNTLATIGVVTYSERLVQHIQAVADVLNYDVQHVTTPSILEHDVAVLDAVNTPPDVLQLWAVQVPPNVLPLFVVDAQSPPPGDYLLRSPFTLAEAVYAIQRVLHATRFRCAQYVSEGFLHAVLGATSTDEILQATADYLADVLPITRMGVLIFDETMREHWAFWQNPPPLAQQRALIDAVQANETPADSWLRLPFSPDSWVGVAFLQVQGPLTRHERELLHETLRVSARVWSRERVLHDNQQRVAEIKVYDLIGRAIVAQSDPQEVLQVIVNSAQASLGASGAVLWLKRKAHLVAVASAGQPRPSNSYIQPADTLLGQVMRAAAPLITDVALTTEDIYSPGSLTRTICVPLVSREQAIGVIQVNNPSGNTWFRADNEWRLRQLASWSVIAINNSELHHRTQTALQRERAARTRLIEAEKLTALGRLVASVAHEVNNPLQIAQSALEWLARPNVLVDEQHGEHLQTAQEAIEQIGAVIQQLRDTYRVNSERHAVDINALVAQIKEMVAYNARQKQIELCLKLDAGLPLVRCTPNEIKQVLLNLALNAIDAIEHDGKICFWTTHNASASEIVIIVEDSGAGIPDDVMASIFEPFFTTKRQGSGLGLAVSREIIEQHNGRISAVSVRGSGTKFMVWLPVH